MTDKLSHWSYSAWSLAKKCPAALKFKNIDRLKTPPVPAMERGTMIHMKAEQYLKGNITGGVPKELRSLKKHYVDLKKAKPIVEEFWGVSEDWKPVERGWCIMKMDAAVEPTKKMPELIIIDHKTGREYDDHESQGSLYIAVGFVRYPKIELGVSEFWYVDQGHASTYEYTRKQMRELVEYWRGEGQRLTSMKKFLPTPSQNACRYCDFRSDKKLRDGSPGPCDAWKKVK